LGADEAGDPSFVVAAHCPDMASPYRPRSQKSFGTKTREWELDTVMSLTRPRDESSTNVLEDDRGSILMEFTKARLRKPATRDQFATRLIYRSDEEWVVGEASIVKKGGRSPEMRQLKNAMVDAYYRLSDGIEPTLGPDGNPVRKIEVDKLSEEVRSRGYLERKAGSDALTGKARSLYYRAKLDLIAEGRLVEIDKLIWTPVTINLGGGR
jgi:hypothetical protein